MQSRSLLNIALFLVVVLLAVYIYDTDKKEQASSESEQLTQLSADEVTQISIQHNQRQIKLRREGGKWRMLQPFDIAANSFRIDTLLNMLKTVSHTAYSAAELELDKYGLSEASTSISFNNITIDFGVVNPINNYRYVRINDTVHLIDDHFYPLLSSQTGTLVARELIDGDAIIDKLVLPQQTLYRDENNLWHSSDNTDPDAISETLHHWQHSQAFGVHNYMQRESLADISVYMAGNSEPIRFYVTDTDPWLIIARPELDIEYHFNLEFHDRLLKPGAIKESAEELSK
jgi:hypothetical protein